MRNTIFLLFINCLIAIKMYSQVFAPIGAEWIYTEKFAFSGNISYLYLIVTGDTIIQGKTCRIIENNGGLDCSYNYEKDFVYSENNKVYFYIPEIDDFQKLYDFDAQKGDYWEILVNTGYKLENLIIQVDSVDNINISNHLLKRLYVTYKSSDHNYNNLAYQSQIIEQIGDISYLFNFHDFSSGIVCDGNYSEGLRCYEDPDFGHYSTGIADSCKFEYKTTDVGIINNPSIFNVYPNPTSDVLYIDYRGKKKYKIEIHNLTGKLILRKESNSSTSLDFTSLDAEIYILSIKHNKDLQTYKIIKK